MATIKRILCPIDFSEGSSAALEHALFFVERFGAELELLHAWQIPYSVRPDLMLWMEAGVSQSIFEATRDQAATAMQQQVAQIPAALRARTEGRTVHGDPVTAILDALGGKTYDMVVMGTHGRTGFSHLLMGSVAERVVRRSPVPVLTVRQPKASKHAAETAASAH